MLCRTCRCQLGRDADACSVCGAARPGAPGQRRYVVVLPDGARAVISGELSVGRAAGNALRLDDRAVSRRHARLIEDDRGVLVEDLGSSSGTFVSGHRVTTGSLAGDGENIRAGDTHLRVERVRDEGEAGWTVVVPVGASLRVGAVTRLESAVTPPHRPRLRSGWALKRLEGSEGPRRYVLADLRGNGFLRFTAEEAEILGRLDGRRTVAELVDSVEREFGALGVQRLAELVAELGERGLLAGVSAGSAAGRTTRLKRILEPREAVLDGAGERVRSLYRGIGYLLFTRLGLMVIVGLALAGVVAFASVVGSGGVRPFHVDGRLSLGALAFIGGRFAVVACHELGHALTLASFGRRPRRIGFKLVVVFPYAFVDTSEVWFEPRRRRIAVSAAGPSSDATVAGVVSLAAAFSGGAARDVAFQLALGAYLGMLLNLNPLLDRDGYHMLADLVGQPALRQRARERAADRLAGRPARESSPRVVGVYAVALISWSVATAALIGVFVARALGPAAGAAVLAAALAPTLFMVVRPLRERWR
jgi:putative peptide zinc metalloprotease protein